MRSQAKCARCGTKRYESELKYSSEFKDFICIGTFYCDQNVLKGPEEVAKIAARKAHMKATRPMRVVKPRRLRETW